jgi:hypothetical protein
MVTVVPDDLSISAMSTCCTLWGAKLKRCWASCAPSGARRIMSAYAGIPAAFSTPSALVNSELEMKSGATNGIGIIVTVPFDFTDLWPALYAEWL